MGIQGGGRALESGLEGGECKHKGMGCHRQRKGRTESNSTIAARAACPGATGRYQVSSQRQIRLRYVSPESYPVAGPSLLATEGPQPV